MAGSNRQLQSTKRFMAFTPSAVAVTPTMGYGDKYLNELRLEVWPEDTFVDFDHALNTAITKIRLALGDQADNPRFVETLPRRGYRFIAPIDKLSSPTSELPPPQRSSQGLTSKTRWIAG